MDGKGAQGILEILREKFEMPRRTVFKEDPFKTLIVTIISQNTADTNTIRAFEELSKQFEIAPEALANAEADQIQKCLKPAGLYRSKVKTIQLISRKITEELGGNLNKIFSLPLEVAREKLMESPGIGPKTADVVLLFGGNRPTIPVDTHVNRVAKRLGLAPLRGDYEAVRESLQSLYDARDYLAVHVLLIAHGRKYCKARNPLCGQCPVDSLCPSRRLRDVGD